MRKIVYLLFVLLMASCASTPKNPATKNSRGDLVGVATVNDFKQEPFGNKWFNNRYANYKTDANTIEKLKPFLKGVKIKGFMGTWCGDSKREVPKFYKILDDANFKQKNIELVTVDRRKKANGLEEGFNVLRVPTFIFYKDGKEIGRFVEHTVNGNKTEADFLKIVSGEKYTHPYQK